MNTKQDRVVELLRLDSRRDLYEGASPLSRKKASGFWFVSYTAEVVYDPLTTDEVNELFYANLLDAKWPGCYKLSANGQQQLRSAKATP